MGAFGNRQLTKRTDSRVAMDRPPFPEFLEHQDFEVFERGASGSASATLAPKCQSAAHVMMQLRFDGALGFPGGLIDPGEAIVDGLNRECIEEIGLDPKHFVTDEDLVFSAFTTKSPRWPRLELHAFAKEVSNQEFQRIEQNVFKAKDFGDETLGLIRVPLYIQNQVDVGTRIGGLPLFPRNCFAGNAKRQLLYLAMCKDLISQEEAENAFKLSVINQNVMMRD